MPPSSSGGVTLIETLNMLETFDLKPLGRWSPECLHLMVEAMKRSYRDRARVPRRPGHRRDPREAHVEGLRARAGPRDRPAPGDAQRGAGRRHSRSGRRASTRPTSPSWTATATPSASPTRSRASTAAAWSCRGAGFLLNDEMNDFAWLPGVTDATGRIGTAAEPGRPRQADALLDAPDGPAAGTARPSSSPAAPAAGRSSTPSRASSSTSSISTWTSAPRSTPRGCTTSGSPTASASSPRWRPIIPTRLPACASSATRSTSRCGREMPTRFGSTRKPATCVGAADNARQWEGGGILRSGCATRHKATRRQRRLSTSACLPSRLSSRASRLRGRIAGTIDYEPRGTFHRTTARPPAGTDCHANTGLPILATPPAHRRDSSAAVVGSRRRLFPAARPRRRLADAEEIPPRSATRQAWTRSASSGRTTSRSAARRTAGCSSCGTGTWSSSATSAGPTATRIPTWPRPARPTPASPAASCCTSSTTRSRTGWTPRCSPKSTCPRRSRWTTRARPTSRWGNCSA